MSIDLEDEVEDGWQITLKFSKPIKELLAWNANVQARIYTGFHRFTKIGQSFHR